MSQARVESEADGKTSKDAVLIHGSLWKAIWVMSWPLMLTTVLSSLVGLADLQVAGSLGSAQQAAVGISEQVLFLYLVFIMSTGVGTTALVSRAFGAGDHAQTIQTTAQSIALSVLMGLVLTVGSLLFSSYGIRYFSTSPDVVAYSISYLQIYSFYLIPFSITCIINAAYRAIGDARTPLIIVGTMTTLNIIGDYLTVVYQWPIAGLGVRGIAWSGVIGSSVGSTLALLFLSRSSLKSSLKQLFPLVPTTLRRIVNIGFPSGLQRFGWALSVFVLFFILAKCEHPTETIASWTIGMRVEGLVFMPLMALSLAVSSIVGQNLGAKQVDRAIKAGWNVTWIGVWMMIVMGSAMFFFANHLAMLMSKDPHTIAITANYLRINSVSEPFLALGMVLSGALQGAGDTRTPMWITLTAHWVVRIPMAFALVLAMNMGPNGAWIAMSFSVILMGLLTTWRFQSKGWVKTEV